MDAYGHGHGAACMSPADNLNFGPSILCKSAGRSVKQ